MLTCPEECYHQTDQKLRGATAFIRNGIFLQTNYLLNYFQFSIVVERKLQFGGIFDRHVKIYMVFQ
jgi:hypothetical protein